jgi:TPR repeat protein
VNARSSIWIFILLLQPAVVAAQPVEYDGGALTSHTEKIQAKAENLYLQGHWERAHFIFQNELAPIGDKYAQYMVGYMYLNGQGVKIDPVMASAWYRVAAERGAREFSAVRDQLLDSLDPDQLAESDSRYVELRKEYGDLVVTLDVLRKERRLRRAGTTGSLLGGGASPVTVIIPQTGMVMTREEFLSREDAKTQAWLDYISRELGIKSLRANLTDKEFQDLEEQVDEFLEIIDDR